MISCLCMLNIRTYEYEYTRRMFADSQFSGIFHKPLHTTTVTDMA